MASQSKPVEEEESSDDKRVPDEEFSGSDANDDDDAKSNKSGKSPVLQLQDDSMSSGQENNDSSEESDFEEENDNGDDDVFPPCYPSNPFLPEQIPLVVYPDDVPRSTPSERNLEFNRMVQNNFVPFAKGLRGEAYRKRTDYEHQQIMGYVGF